MNVKYEYHGEKLPLAEIARRVGMTKPGLYYRMKHFNCSAQEAAEMQIPEKAKRYTWIDGRELTIKEISAITKISTYTISERLRIGIPFMDACTKGKCNRRDYKLDVVPRLSEFERYMRHGEPYERAAKEICRAMMGIDPRKLDLREVDYWHYLFDTDCVAFEIEIKHDIARCIGKMKSNGNVLIRRKYRIGEKNKEVAVWLI